MTKPLELYGRAGVVPVSDVDTDMIFHNRYLHVTKPAEMGRYIFGNLKDWESFPAETLAGDILIVGPNFGCGSSRQQAVDGFIALGVCAVIGESFGAIYRRNAINAGWPLIECQGVLEAINDKDEISVNLSTGEIRKIGAASGIIGTPMTAVQAEIYQAGGLLELI